MDTEQKSDIPDSKLNQGKKTDSPVKSDQSAQRRKRMVLVPYAIAIAALSPLLVYYMTILWGRPHYQFFPFALILVGVFAYLRWPRHLDEPFFSRKLSTVLFWAGIIFGIAATLFSETWFAAASAVMLLTSLFARTRDGEVAGKSLLVLGLPLLIILMPPNNLDFRVITTLQQASAKVSSLYLDMLNFKHHSPGTTLNFPDQNYEVERACSGVQSFFTLLFCTSFLIISLRRTFWRSLLLLISAGFWAVFMNSIRILTIPIADQVFQIDLTKGIAHAMLGYAAMLVAVLLILSTDQLLEFLLGRNRKSMADEESSENWFSKTFIRSRDQSNSENSQGKFKPVSIASQRVAIAGAIVVLLLGSLQFYDFAKSMGQSNSRVRAFSRNVLIDLDENALPANVESSLEGRGFDWDKVGYDRTDRSIGSDFGQRSDSWTYRSSVGELAQASIDQTFPGWHELTTCYKNSGWKINPGARRKKSTEFSESGGQITDWSYIECDMVDPTTGQHGFLLFSFTDANGNPIEAPIEWGNLRAFYERAKNRLFHSLRSSLFSGEAYQMQVFVPSQSALSPARKEEIRNQYLQIREEMREALLTYGGASPTELPQASSATEKSAGSAN
ncbi:MAG: exosortase U [Pirellulaceae bacterium]|nr:exosortase U [Pirellulaceae bacterium]